MRFCISLRYTERSGWLFVSVCIIAVTLYDIMSPLPLPCLTTDPVSPSPGFTLANHVLTHCQKQSQWAYLRFSKHRCHLPPLSDEGRGRRLLFWEEKGWWYPAWEENCGCDEGRGEWIWGKYREREEVMEGGGDGGRRGQNSFHLSISTSKATPMLLWFHQHLLSEEEEEEGGRWTGGGLLYPHIDS